MRPKILLSFFVAILFAIQNFAQQPVDCGLPSPPGEDDCNDACVYCDLTSNGYVGSTIGYTSDTPPGFCGTIENNQWFAFAAGTTTIEFTIIASNCLNGDGVQGAIYSGCGPGGPIACNGGNNNGAAIPIVVTATGLTVGNIYWFMVDGWLGDECDYDVTVTQGNTDPPPLDPPGPIDGPTEVCSGEMATYSVPALPGASYYEWVLPDGTVVTGEDPFVDYTFGPGGQICVTANNVCNFSDQVCITLTVVEPDAGTLTITPTTLCPNEIATISVTDYNADPEFTQVVFVTNSQDVIVEVLDPDGGTFTSSECAAFQICSYNYLTADFQSPMVGDELSTFDCNAGCCDIICESISFEDTESPVFTNPPANETLTCYDLLMPLMDLEWTDNCDGTGVVVGVESGSADLCAGGTITRAWDYTDACGNIVIHSQTITIDPMPEATFQNPPADMTVDCNDIPTGSNDLTYDNNGLGGCALMGSVTPTESGSGDICGGDITYTWEFTDVCNRTITHTQTITITPADPPTFIDPPSDETVDCNSIPSNPTDLNYTNSGIGDCLIEGTVSPTESGSADICGGEITYTWDFTDLCGNNLNHTQTITVTPPAPVTFINPPPDETVACDNVPSSAPDLSYTNNETGACLFEGMVSPTENGSVDICGGTITYTWEFIDPCNNNINHTQSVTVDPAPAPVFINPPSDMTVDCESIPVMEDLDYDNNVTGACAVNGTVIGNETNNYDVCGGTISRIWTFTDPCSNSITHTQVITISPAPAPVFSNLPADITLACGDMIPPIIDLNYDNGETGICAINGITQGVESGNYDACGGSLVRTWTYTDGCNSIDHTQTITITPAQAPTFSNPPPSETVNCDAVTPAQPLTYDNGLAGICNISGTVQASESGSFDACGGAITRNWIFTDACGNNINHTQTITVLPAAAPTFQNPPGNTTMSCDAVAANPLDYDNGQLGDCNISGSVTPVQSGTYDACGGAITFTWDFTDECGNNINHTQSVTVTPAAAPTFNNPPQSTTVSCGSIPPLQPLFYTNNGTGVCAISGSVTGEENGTYDACGGQITRMWTFTDICGNTISHQQSITVNPATAPTFTNPPVDITLTCGDPLPQISNLFYTNNQTGNCANNGSAPGTESGSYDACGGQLVRTWEANAACGFTFSHSQTITINPAPAPTFISPPADIQVDCGDIPPLPDLFYTNGLTGLCEIAGTTPGMENGTYDACGGTLTRTWTVTDFCGNMTDHVQIITVSPAPPTAFTNLPQDINLNCGDPPPPLTDLFYDNGFTGLCALSGSAPGQETGELDACGGELIRTWDFTDACGNILSHTQIISSLPAPAPVFDLPPQGTFLSCDEDYPMAPLFYDNGAVGICNISGSVMGQDIVIADDGCSQDIDRVWTYTDDCGNTIDAVELIFVTDFTPPVMDTPPPNQVIPCSDDVPPMTELGWTDNCEGSGTVIGTDVSDGGNPETITRTWEYVDGCGNVDMVSQIFTVNNFEILQAVAGICDNQGTLSDPTDDTFTATVEAIISSPGPSNQYTVTDGTNTWGPFTYGSPATIPDLPADGSSIILTFTDVDDTACSATASISQLACSTDCLLVIEPYTLGDCNDNGTPSDDTDDFFDITLNASITNGGASNQFNVTDGTNTWGPFDYGTGGVISNLPANGSTITLTFSDVDIPGCANQLAISLISCSSQCLLSVTDALVGLCQNLGTLSDPSDDIFDVEVNASAENPGASNQFTVTDGTTTWGPFDYNTGGTLIGLPANGTLITLTFVDADDPACSATVDVSQSSCSDLCVLTVDQTTPGACNDNGTNADPSDDFFEVTVNATAINPGSSNQYTVTDGATSWGPFDYGTNAIIAPLPANGNTLTLTFSDTEISACAQQIQVSSNPCSSSCILSIDQFLAGACNDNGTPSDPTDDTFDLTVNASATNGGTTGQYTVTDGTTTWGPFDYGTASMITGLPSDGSLINFTFTDVDDISCNAITNTSSPSCSDLCVLSIDQTIAGACNDNGTNADPNDDFFDLTINASAINPGASSQYIVTDGVSTWGPFDYGSNEIIPSLPANGNNITLIFTDVEITTCSQQVQVSSNPCSSSCTLTIDQLLTGDCNDQGTPADPADDIFDVTVSASASNPGPSGQFTVSDGTTTWGPFDYGTGGSITGLPADGSIITLTFTDVDDISCNAFQQVSSDSCSPLCILTIEENTVGACDDNGTDADPSDDFYEVTVNASAMNAGATGQFTVTDGTTTWGPFDYGTGGIITDLPADGNTITFTFSDVDDPTCNATADIVQFPCSSSCILVIEDATIEDCDDNGTPSDPSDDIFQVTVNASATNSGASGQFTVTDGTTTWGPFDYNVGGIITDLPADGSTISLTFIDADDSGCNAFTEVSSDSCSPLCVFTIEETTIGVCDDNGTDSDASDDFYQVTVNASAINQGTTGQFTVTDGTTTWGPFDYGTGGVITDLPADGNTITFTFSDVDNPTCNATADVVQFPCSSSCILVIEDATVGDCDDNETPSDSSDDIFQVTVNASATNPGASGQFTVTDGTTTWGPFDYNVGGIITDLPADGTTIGLTFIDADDSGCNAFTEVSSDSCSPLCVFTIEETTIGACDDNGTDSDASDDFYQVTVNASAINQGATGQFTVTDGTTTWGPFDYGTGGIITDLPADGNTITFTFSDVDNPTCNATADVVQFPCSSSCILVIEDATVGDCDDNGTLSDPSDDIYQVTVNASATNSGASGQFTVTDGTTTWGPFDYNVGGIITDLPADGSTISLTFIDADDSGCNAFTEVSSDSCSPLCVFTIEETTIGVCDDNGTDSDASDDFYQVTVNASAINPGATGQFTVTDGTTTWGPFDYGTGGVIPDLPADGNTITFTFSDVDNPICNATADVVQFPCSSSCILVIEDATTEDCDDNGTPSDPSDDIYQVTVNASATNSGASGQFTVTDGTTTWGPFDYNVGGIITDLPADGSTISLTFIDADDSGCNAFTEVSSDSCSPLCVFTIEETTIGVCDDNGTDSDASDDFYQVTVNASAINPGATGQFTVTDGTMTWGPFDYGTGGVITDLPADGSTIGLTFIDVDDPTCNATADVVQFPCSSSCILVIEDATVEDCDDNGTPSDPSDDIFQVTVNASATNPGASGQFTVTDGATTWGPFDYNVGGIITDLPADGTTIGLTFIDADDSGCNAFTEVSADSCSPLCVFTIEETTIGVCDDNGTDSDASDDFYQVTVNASAINPGATGQFTVTDGTTTWGPFDYGTGGIITDLPADGNTITFTFSDVDNPTCNATADVVQFPCSSSCILVIEDATVEDCDDNGTPSDPSDDIFQVTVNASATNPGASGQFTVTDGTTTWGPFDYNVGGIITDLPADGSTIGLTFIDADDSGCNAFTEVSSDSCSPLCVFTIEETTIGVCDDNGTDSDASDDFYQVTVNASAINPGATGQFTVTDGTTTWGPFDYGTGGIITDLPADGNTITFTFSDVDDPTCNESADVVQFSCSSTCVLIIEDATIGDCDDNGTPSDSSDDVFQVTVNASATNPGATGQFTVTDGTTTWGPFDYGTGGIITDLPANGSIIGLTFLDADDSGCNAFTEVSSESCSPLCVFTIEETTIGACDDNGTLADDTDDTFDVTINASAINPGTAEQFTVTDGISIWGPFDYGVGGIISDLPANGNIIILTFTDADDTNCSDNVSVSQESCSDCNLTVDAGPGQELSCSILNVQLFGTSNEVVFFEWSGPGINASNQNLENPVVELPGTYTLTVSNLTTGCEETDQVFVDIIDDAPIAVASTPDMITCETTSLTLSSNGSTTGSSILYEWSGPDPDLEINDPNPEITTPGSYILVVTDTLTNCVSQPDTVNVGLNTEAPIAIINLIGSLSCISTSTLLDGAGSSIGDSIQYQWLWEEQIIPGATDLTTVISEPGLYTFVVLNIINGCNASDSILVVDDMTYPVASAGEPALLNCLIDSVQLNGSASTNLAQITYEWSGPAGGILSGENTTTPWVGLPGTYIISVVDTINGCANLDSVIVDQDIVAPIANAGSDVILDCNSLQADLDGSSSSNGFPYTLQWLENNGSILSGEETLQPVVNATGDYTLIITNTENGCTTTDNVIVSPPNIPTDVIISMINPTCVGDSDGIISIDSVIGGQPPYSYELNNQGLSSSNTFGFISAGVYTLSVVDSEGCGFETSITMQDGAAVYIELEEDITIDLGDSVTLQSYINLLPSEIDSLQWLPIDGTLDCYDCEEPVAKPFYTTEYTATVWDLNGCTARDEITIFVRKDRDIYIPNAFSPNGDGINDVFVIYTGRLDVKQINSLHIYSRWGEEVFENSNFQPNDETHGWDGTLRGEAMNPAVFVYWAEIEFVDGFIGFYKGDVTIVK